MSGVCGLYISFVLSSCVQSFDILDKLGAYVSLLIFYCLSFVGVHPELVADVGPECVSISPPSNTR